MTRWRSLRPGPLQWSASVLLAVLLFVACAGSEAAGDPEAGARLFTSLPCAGCHGAQAQGQFGPTLAGTDLSFAEVRRQVRSPRDQMPAFTRERVSDEQLRDIYAWLTSLSSPAATPVQTLPPAEATIAARNRFYPEMDAATLRNRVDALDEVAFRVSGEITAIEAEGRYTVVRLHVAEGGAAVDVHGLYDTALAREPFPAAVGDQVTLYGIGAKPVEVTDATGAGQLLPQLQILYATRR